MNPHIYGNLTLDKRAKKFLWGFLWETDSMFNNLCWINWRSASRKMQINPFLSPCAKLKSKWIQDLHIKPDTLKFMEEKVGKSLEHMGTGEIFLNSTPIAYALRTRIYILDLRKLESFSKAKDTINRTKQQSIDWEKNLYQSYIQ